MAAKTDSIQVKCPQCNFRTKAAEGLFLHIKSMHTVPAPPPSPPIPPIPIRKNMKKCFICKMSFSKSDECYTHISRSHGPLNCSCGRCSKKTETHRFLIKSSAKDGDQKYNLYKCVLCSSAFLGLCRCLVHCQEEHIEDPFECAQCNTTYKTHIDLSKHMATHLKGDDTYHVQTRCSYCKSGSNTGTKFFKRPVDLYKHMVEIHHFEEEVKARRKFEANEKKSFHNVQLSSKSSSSNSKVKTPDEKTSSRKRKAAAKDNQSERDGEGRKSKGRKKKSSKSMSNQKSNGSGRKDTAEERTQEKSILIPCSMRKFQCTSTFKSFMSYKNHMVVFHKWKENHETISDVGKTYGHLYQDQQEENPPSNDTSDDDWAPSGTGAKGLKIKTYTRTQRSKPSVVRSVPSPVPSPARSAASSDISSLTSASSPIQNQEQEQLDETEIDDMEDVQNQVHETEIDDTEDVQNQVHEIIEFGHDQGTTLSPNNTDDNSDQYHQQNTLQEPAQQDNEGICTTTNCQACLLEKTKTKPCSIVLKKEPMELILSPSVSTTSEAQSSGYTTSEAQLSGYTTSEAQSSGYTTSEAQLSGYTTSEAQSSGYTSDFSTSQMSHASGFAASPYSASLPVASQMPGGIVGPITIAQVEGQCTRCLSETAAKYMCHPCQMIFLDPDVYTLHKLWHDREDPYKCSYCGKSCGSRYLFATHIFRDPHP